MKTPAADHGPRRNASKPRRRSRSGEQYARYHQLKAELTAAATTSAEYEAACRRAADIAGV